MTRESAPLVSKLHKRAAYLTPQALCHEYFENPDASRLYYGLDPDGIVAASQAWVGQTLIRNGEIVPTLMSERTLLATAYWARADYRSFYLWTLAQTASATGPGFVWGSTSALKAFKRYGFEMTDCLSHDAVIFHPAHLLRVVVAAASWKWRAYHLALYGLSLAKHWLSLCWLQSTPWTVCEEVPSEEELASLMKAVSRANPESYFMHYTRPKLAWFATGNPYRKRQVATLRRDGALEGLAVVEDRLDGLATIVDFLVPDPTQAHGGFLALARFYGRRGHSGLYYWGNRLNSHVAAMRRGLRRLGGVSLRKVDAQLAIRGATSNGKAHPAASAIAMTWIWQSPV